MPELPEVEFARRCWERWAVGRKVKTVVAPASRILRPAGPRALATLVGARFVRARRRGKNLLLTAERGRQRWGLRSHLGMTGKWLRRPTGAPAPRFTRVRLDLAGGHSIFYCDMRLFGRLQLVENARFEDIPEVAALGPDPLTDGVDAGRLLARLQTVAGPIKVALLDQSLLAGVGNIQASEALFRARLDPRRRARSLTRLEVRRLATAIVASIRATLAAFRSLHGPDGDIAYVEERGTPNRFAVYGKAGQPCPRCRQAIIRRIVQAGRATFFCPSCER